MAGTDPRFNAAQFRSAIKFAMEMGAVPNENEQATFYMPTVLVYNTGVDGDNYPFDPAATVTSVTPAPIKVDCAIEYYDANDVPTPFGPVTPAKVAITVLDEDYALIEGFKYVVIRGEKYLYHHTVPPVGLFDVGVYTVYANAESQV